KFEQKIGHQVASGGRVLCVPSQNGGLPVRLQVQKNRRLSSIATYCIGSKLLSSWLPSQNGWLEARPQPHHPTSSPVLTSTGIGARPPIAGSSLMPHSPLPCGPRPRRRLLRARARAGYSSAAPSPRSRRAHRAG